MIAASAPTATDKLLLTEREAAELLNVSPRTVWQMNADGLLPAVRLTSRCKRYRRTTIEHMLAELETTPTKTPQPSGKLDGGSTERLRHDSTQLR